MAKKRKNTTGIPDFEIDSLARALLPAIQKYFDTEEGQKEFEAWQAERQKSQLSNRNNDIKARLKNSRIIRNNKSAIERGVERKV